MNISTIDRTASTRLSHWLIGLGLGGVLWVAAYSQLTAFADAVVGAFGLSRATHFGEAVHFFFYDTPKVLLLLTGIVFVMGVIQTFLVIIPQMVASPHWLLSQAHTPNV